MADRTCVWDGCERERRYREHCQKHYDAIKRDRAERNALRARQRIERPEVTRAYNARYYAEHRDQEFARCRVWRQANPERHRANSVRWLRANPEKAREQWQRKHAARWSRIVGTRIGPVDYAAVIERHGMWCHLCQHDITSLDDLHLDHVIPLALGGPHTEDNLRPAHALCNQKKGAKILVSTHRRTLAAPAP